MKFRRSAVAAALAPTLAGRLGGGAGAFLTTAPLPLRSSAFAGGRTDASRRARRGQSRWRRGDALMYREGSDPGDKRGAAAWSALRRTERWIEERLRRGRGSASSGGGGGGDGGGGGGGERSESNPVERGEVSYACEGADNAAAAVCSTFRRLREARELGEGHGREEERRSSERGPKYIPGTLRQTHVVIMPACDELTASFRTFDDVMRAIARARRVAADYVTDMSLAQSSDGGTAAGGGEWDWTVEINCAHLHPRWGETTPPEEETLAETEHVVESDGEADMADAGGRNDMRNDEARRSPYPTFVVEVGASPRPGGARRIAPRGRSEDEVSVGDVRRLKGLFRMPAALDHPTDRASAERDGDRSNDTTGIDEGPSFVAPAHLARGWVARNDPAYDESSSAFSASAEAAHADAAYEFVFSVIGADRATMPKPPPAANSARALAPGGRTYLAMTNFLTSSATSFERFEGEVTNIIDAIPGLSGFLEVSTLHPEHVDRERRSTVPIFVLQWYEGKDSV